MVDRKTQISDHFILGLVGAVLAAPPYVIWRLATRARRSGHQRRTERVQPAPASAP